MSQSTGILSGLIFYAYVNQQTLVCAQCAHTMTKRLVGALNVCVCVCTLTYVHRNVVENISASIAETE
jgi:hypothetical protein